MKSRWIAFLGRTGSTLLVVGLALALLSLVPTAPGMFNAMGGGNVRPENYFVLPSTRVGSPQIGARITLTVDTSSSLCFIYNCTSSVQLYLLTTDAFELMNWAETWAREHFPDLNETQIWSQMYNVSVLHEFLQAHPGALLHNETVNGEHSVDYFPSKVTNVTIVISNPSLLWADSEIRLVEIATLVPRERVVMPALVLLASGAILILPSVVTKKFLAGRKMG
jgi:hypothetical protein